MSKKQKIVNESNGLLCLFGNRIVSKYNDEYLDRLKKQYGSNLYLKHLGKDNEQNEDSNKKYSLEYLKKKEKRNEAVVKYRDKQKQNLNSELIFIQNLHKENKFLKKELEELNNNLKTHRELVEKLRSKINS